VVNHCQTILGRGFATLMNENEKDSLQVLYELFSDVKLLDKLKEAFVKYIQ